MAQSRKSKLDKFLARLPYYFSFVILITTWMLFMLFISLGEILIRRREIGRFLEQMVVYHFLLGMTLLCLVTTASRLPGEPDQTLAPPMTKKQKQKPNQRRPASLAPFQNRVEPVNGPDNSVYPSEEGHDAVGTDDTDDVPLRYLRNAQWVNTRMGKDRPSPLPLPNTRRYPPLPPTAPASSSTNRTSPSEASSTGSGPGSDTDVQSATESESDFSPFPLSAFSVSTKSPFVPNTAEEAGEDEDEDEDDLAQEEAIDQLGEPVPSTLGNDTDGLLMSSRTDGSEDRSLMAKSNTGEVRWCKKCEGWKPDRCHHCRYCEQCVLKMDHHCPWVGSCVGYHNYKPFFLFINYATLLAVYATLEAGYETFRFFQDPDAAVPHSKIVQLEGDANGTIPFAQPIATSSETWSDGLGLSPAVFMMLFVMGGFMTLAIGGLAIFHWYLATHNQTTLENITHSYPSALLDTPPKGRSWKADHLLTRAERFRLREEAREINVYDLGWKRNLRDLMIGGEGRIGRFGWIKAFFPVGRPMRFDGRAGHYFAYDAEKLDRLKELTAELRYGIKSKTKRTASTRTDNERKSRLSNDSNHSHSSDNDDHHDVHGSIDGIEERVEAEKVELMPDRSGNTRRQMEGTGRTRAGKRFESPSVVPEGGGRENEDEDEDGDGDGDGDDDDDIDEGEVGAACDTCFEMEPTSGVTGAARVTPGFRFGGGDVGGERKV
ncbi:hypothetical protein IAT40_004634 [Kwoniella sp. CBS 6097]